MAMGTNYQLKLWRKRLTFRKIITLPTCTGKDLWKWVGMDCESI